MSEKRKVTKTERIQVVMDVLVRWGKQDKKEILNKVAARINEDADDPNFERAIYRDLVDLVHNNRIKADNYTRDGVLIEDFDEDKNKNYSSKWYIPSAEGEINGANNLAKQNGLLIVPPILKTECSIGIEVNPDSKHRHFYFHAGNVFFGLKTSLEAIEYSVAISRTHGDLKTNEVDEVIKKLGKRAIILKLPDAKLSSYKADERIAHANVKVLLKNEIEIEDFGSTNGVTAYKLTMGEADELRSNGENINIKTVMNSWVQDSSFIANPIKVSKILVIQTPVLLEFGETYHILVI